MIRAQKPQIKAVAIYTHNKPSKEKEEAAFLEWLLVFLKERGVKRVNGDVRTLSLLKNKISLINDDAPYDLKIGIGGDGTILKMIRTLQRKDGYILGINFGTLGFLSELQPDTAENGLKKVFQGKFYTDERMLLKAFVWRKNVRGEKEKIFRAYALNDLVFGHGGLARLTNFKVRVNRRNLSTYRADGLIFATPTGSTAYSLSAGGPIVSHALDCVVVTPVSPHRLTHRPIVLPASRALNMEFDARAETISLTVDGQLHFSLKTTDEITIQAANRRAKFIRMKEHHFFRTLRNKMGWGEKK
ncbi:MAG: NAD(+)/NADH kinase [Candidatus Gracilibacteria bacterium]|nr:NAD(+)/NADH kinase [Candidatus Gracilibacteria bacterium]